MLNSYFLLYYLILKKSTYRPIKQYNNFSIASVSYKVSFSKVIIKKNFIKKIAKILKSLKIDLVKLKTLIFLGAYERKRNKNFIY